MKKYTLIATSSFGLEGVVSDEVKDLGFEVVKVSNGKVEFIADAEGICLANLWLRCAERVFIKIDEFEAYSFDSLFTRIYEYDWHNFVQADSNVVVKAKSIKSTLFSVPDIQSICKKAIVKNIQEYNSVDWLKETGATYPVTIEILKDNVTVLLDTSGVGLHKRGYRLKTSKAPIRETLAAAIIKLSMWKKDRVFIDPFCGSGTIPIEAALIAKNIAPGLKREFISETWDLIDKETWKRIRKEAFEDIDNEIEPKIIGTDIDFWVLKVARENAVNAGVDDCVHFQEQSFDQISSKNQYGYVVTNPPYGERLSDEKEIKRLYQKLGKTLFASLETWSFSIITSYESFQKVFGRKANKNRKLYNGMIKCYLYNYYGPKPPRRPHD